VEDDDIVFAEVTDDVPIDFVVVVVTVVVGDVVKADTTEELLSPIVRKVIIATADNNAVDTKRRR